MGGRSSRFAGAIGAIGALLVALVLAHSVVYLVRYGSAFGEALAHSGHDGAWTVATWSTAVLGLGLAIAGLVQLVRLSLAVRAPRPIQVVGERAPPNARPGSGFGPTWLRMSVRLSAATAILLTAQENLERLGAGLPIPGPGVLVSEEYPWALAIVLLVSVAIGLVIALFRWRRAALLARLRSTRRGPARPARLPRPASAQARPSASLLGLARALRAPPSAFAS